jgi:hypothetical protein
MQTCNFTPNRQLRKSDAVCASASTNQCTIAPRLNLLKIDPEQPLSPKSDEKNCVTSDSKETARPSKSASSGKRRLAFLVLAAALNGCVPDSILLSQTDASAEVSQVDAAEEDSEVPDVKKPRRDASLDEEEVDASLDVAEEDASSMDADASDAVSEDVPNDRVTPPRDSPDADVEDVVSEDVPNDRVVPPMDVLDVLDAPEDRVVPPMDVPRDIVSEPSLSDVVPDSPGDVRDVPADTTRYCTSLGVASTAFTNIAIGSCIPNMDGSSNSTCPTMERLSNSGLALFLTSTDGSRTQFTIRTFCVEGGNATMELGPSTGNTITLRGRTDHFGWCLSNGISSFDFDLTDAFYRSTPEGFAARGSVVYRVNSTSHTGAPCGATFTTMVRTP